MILFFIFLDDLYSNLVLIVFQMSKQEGSMFHPHKIQMSAQEQLIEAKKKELQMKKIQKKLQEARDDLASKSKTDKKKETPTKPITKFNISKKS